MSLHQLYVALFVGGLVLLASIIATRLATGLGLPSLLLFLGVGVFVGEDGIGLSFDDAQLAQNLGTAALGIILVEGGLTTRFSDVRKVLAPAGVLATVGVGVSAVVTATCVHLLLGIDWQLALLMGAIVSSTDAAAVFSVLRVVPLPRRLGGLCWRPNRASTTRLRSSWCCCSARSRWSSTRSGSRRPLSTSWGRAF